MKKIILLFLLLLPVFSYGMKKKPVSQPKKTIVRRFANGCISCAAANFHIAVSRIYNVMRKEDKKTAERFLVKL